MRISTILFLGSLIEQDDERENDEGKKNTHTQNVNFGRTLYFR